MGRPVAPAGLPGTGPGSLRSNVAWTISGNVVYAACQWGMLVALARLGTPATVGEFSLALALTAPVVMFTNLQLASVLATDARGEFPFRVYRRLRVVMAAVALAAIAVLTLALGYRGPIALVILVVAVAKGVEAISDVHYGWQQRAERMDRIARSQILRGTLGLAALAALMAGTDSLLAAVGGLFVVWGAVLLFYDRPAARLVPVSHPGPPPTRAELRTLAIMALPLGLTAMLTSLNVNAPRVIVERFLGTAPLGIFAAMAYVVIGGRMVVTPFGQVLAPRFGLHRARREMREFRRLLGRLLLVGLVLGASGVVVAAAIGEPLLRFLYGAEYARENPTFVLLMAAGGIGYLSTFLQTAMTAARRLRPQVPIIATAIVVGVAGCLVLVPRLGLRGAGWGVLLGAAVELAGCLIVSYPLWRGSA